MIIEKAFVSKSLVPVEVHPITDEPTSACRLQWAGLLACQKLPKIEWATFAGWIIVACRLSWIEVFERTEIIIQIFFLIGPLRGNSASETGSVNSFELLIVSSKSCQANLEVSS